MAMDVLPNGTQLASYRIDSLIGRGGMAVVYKADDIRLDRKVALKLLAPELMQHENFRLRFIRESRVAASIDHPNIIPIYEAGEADDLLFIAMRLVVGSDLHALIVREKPLDPDRALKIFTQIADALDAAHTAGLVHRDVKPGNILMTQAQENVEHVYLTDFGLTKRMTSLTGGLTGAGNFLGTIDYVAPEQIAAKPVGPQTDIYALGCVLYEVLAGKLPFERDDDAALLWAHLVESPPPVTAVRPELPQGVDGVVARAMAKAPEERYVSCHDLVLDLRAALAGAAVPAAARRDAGGPSTFLGTSGSAPDVETRPADEKRADSWAAVPPQSADKPAPTQHPSFPPGGYDPRIGAAPPAPPPGAPADIPRPEPEYAGTEPVADEGWGDEWAETPGDGEEDVSLERRRPWMLIGVVAAALIGVVIAVTGYFLLSGGESLSNHQSKTTIVPLSFDYPGDWQKGKSGVDVVFSPGANSVGQLFANRGTGDSWEPTRILLNSNPGDAVGLYTSLSSTEIDPSTPDGLETLQSLLPADAKFGPRQEVALVGGFAAKRLEGRLVDPAAGTELAIVTYVVQAQQAVNGTVQLTFFSAPDELTKNRALFDDIKKTVSFAG